MKLQKSEAGSVSERGRRKTCELRSTRSFEASGRAPGGWLSLHAPLEQTEQMSYLCGRQRQYVPGVESREDALNPASARRNSSEDIEAPANKEPEAAADNVYLPDFAEEMKKRFKK